MLINLAIFLVLFTAALVIVINSGPGQANPLLFLPSGVFGLATVIPHVAALARRLHDGGHSGVWSLLVFVPFGSLVVLILSLLSGTVGQNEYGPDPKAPKLAPQQPLVPQPPDAPAPPAAPLVADSSAPAPYHTTVPGYYPPGPVPIPPPRKSRTLPVVMAVVGGVLVVLVLTAAVVQGVVAAYRQRESSARSASAIPTPTDSLSPSPTPTFTPYNGDLADLLLPIPAGATPYTIPGLTPGITDTQRVSMIWNHDQPTWMSNALTEYNFRRSADREWTLPGDAIFLILLQFSQPSDATNWYERVSIQGFSGSDVESTGASISARVLTSRYETIKLSTGHRSQIGLAVYGQFAIFVVVATGTPQTDFPTLQNVAVSQYQRLPAS